MARQAAEPGTERLDADAARFFLALGAVGYLAPAAELAGVDLADARRLAAGLPRPTWTARRREAAAQLFAVATEALAQVTARLRGGASGGETTDADTGSVAGSGLSLRELVLVAEHFYAAALRLDKDVAADGHQDLGLDLDGWSSEPDAPARPAAPAPGAVGGDSL